MEILAILGAWIASQDREQLLAGWNREHAHPAFGLCVGAHGDLDGDGIEELVIGDPGRCFTTTEPPSFWVVSPRSRSVLCRIDLPVAASASYAIDGSADLDGDAKPDLLIAQGSYEANERPILHLMSSAHGRAWLSIPMPEGSAPRWGSWAIVVPDVDGDARSDVAAARRAPNGEGSVILYSSRTGSLVREISVAPLPELTAISLETWLDAAGIALAVSTAGRHLHGAPVDVFDLVGARRRWSYASALQSTYGAPSRSIGDLDGDGRAELALGTNGHVEWLDGATGGLVRRRDRDPTSEASSLGGVTATGFGTALAAPGDLDGDGVPDLVVGEPEAGIGDGVVHAFSGKDGRRLWIADRTDPQDVCRFGRELAVIGDVDGDHRREILVGTWQSPTNSPGRAMLLSGASGRVLFEIRRIEHDLVIAERFPFTW